MSYKLLLCFIAFIVTSFCIAQEASAIDCGSQSSLVAQGLSVLAEEQVELINMMRSHPQNYHTRGLGFQAVRKNLNGFDFSNLAFEYAQFFRSSLESANFQKSRVIGAIFTSVNLQKANLEEMNARNANFAVANLCQANLARANLRGASLSGANLRYSTLTFANLAMTDMSRVDLTDADLKGAVLVGAILDTKTVTLEQLATTASLHNVILEKQGYEDKAMLDTLMELHPHLFDEIPLSVWFRPSQHFPDRIRNWYYSKQ